MSVTCVFHADRVLACAEPATHLVIHDGMGGRWRLVHGDGHCSPETHQTAEFCLLHAAEVMTRRNTTVPLPPITAPTRTRKGATP